MLHQCQNAYVEYDDVGAVVDGGQYLPMCISSQNISAVRTIQTLWRARASQRLSRAMVQIREMCKCVVCDDECVKIVRCTNGHSCCVGCVLGAADSRCPICRETRVTMTPDALVADVLHACETRMRCNSCNIMFRSADCERHRAWCPAHQFVCPCSMCTQCIPASKMAAHVVQNHDDVSSLTAFSNGSFHLVFTAGLGRDNIVFAVNDVTVVIGTCGSRASRLSPDPAMIGLSLRAYYPTSTSPSLVATLHQMRVSDCNVVDSWCDAHRYGVIPPMIASRETVVLAPQSASVVPRVMTFDPYEVPRLILPDHKPGVTPGLMKRVRDSGLRDVPLMTPSMPRLDACTPMSLLHLVLHFDEETPIGSLYDC